MKSDIVILSSLFDRSGKEGISEHYNEIVTKLAESREVLYTVLIDRGSRGAGDDRSPVSGLGCVMFVPNKNKMSIAVLKILSKYLLNIEANISRKNLSKKTVVFFGYHWNLLIPFMPRSSSIVYVPFDCWSAREWRISRLPESPVKQTLRRGLAVILSILDKIALGRAALIGVVSEEEGIKFLNLACASSKVEAEKKLAVIPQRKTHDVQERVILANETINVLIWIDCRVSYGRRSIITTLSSFAALPNSVRRNFILTALTRIPDSEFDFLSAESAEKNCHNLSFAENLVPFLSSFDVIILPDVSGSGVKSRVLESLSSGALVVASKSAAEGFNVKLADCAYVYNCQREFEKALTEIYEFPQDAKRKLKAVAAFMADQRENGLGDTFWKKLATL